MDTTTIRMADESDVGALIEYVAALRAERLPTIFRHDDVPTRDEEIAFVRRHSGERAALFIAIDDGRIVGNLGVVAHAHPETRHCAALGVSVLAPQRGRGIGSRLLDTVIAWAPQRSIRRLELEVRSNNPGARRLYERKGFTIEGIRRGANVVDGEPIDSILMALLLPPRA